MIAKNSIKNNNSNTISIGSILYDNREDGYEINEEMNKEIKDYKSCININEEDVSSSNTIYRYKFTEDFMVDLYKFAKIHQYDDRKDFKEAWLIWVEDNKDIVDEEIHRLLYLGYEGDILDKMFKSARYYFRKKGTSVVEAKKRRPYVSLQKEFLVLMDAHIAKYNLKPSEGFDDFCNSHVDNLKEEITYLFGHDITDTKTIKDKFKKTYKNRYFSKIKM